jgi:uncharacterized protein (DUF934 family)
MPLVTRHGLVEDGYRRLAEGETPDGSADVIVPLSRLEEALGAPPRRLGVDVPNTARLEAILPLFSRLDLVCLPFPAFTDGRSFSLARQIRGAGFARELRATGNLLPDQLQFMAQVGFDSFEVSDRHPPQAWLAALEGLSLSYQVAGGGAHHVWQERRARSLTGCELQASVR